MNKIEFYAHNAKVGDTVVFKDVEEIRRLHLDGKVSIGFDNMADPQVSKMSKFVALCKKAKITVVKPDGSIRVNFFNAADEAYAYSHDYPYGICGYTFDPKTIRYIIPAKVYDLKHGMKVRLKSIEKIKEVYSALGVNLYPEMRDFILHNADRTVTINIVYLTSGYVQFCEDQGRYLFSPFVIDFEQNTNCADASSSCMKCYTTAEVMRDLTEQIDQAIFEEICKSANTNKNKEEKEMNIYTAINKVMYNKPATIVFWKDGTKTVSVCHEEDTFDPEKGLAICILKKLAKPSQVHDVLEDFTPKNNENCQISLHDILKEKKKKAGK